jgi:hypothetical protein
MLVILHLRLDFLNMALNLLYHTSYSLNLLALISHLVQQLLVDHIHCVYCFFSSLTSLREQSFLFYMFIAHLSVDLQLILDLIFQVPNLSLQCVPKLHTVII